MAQSSHFCVVECPPMDLIHLDLGPGLLDGISDVNVDHDMRAAVDELPRFEALDARAIGQGLEKAPELVTAVDRTVPRHLGAAPGKIPPRIGGDARKNRRHVAASEGFVDVLNRFYVFDVHDCSPWMAVKSGPMSSIR